MKLFRFSLVVIGTGLGLSTISPASSAAPPVFQVPSGNIHCAVDAQYGLDCEIGQNKAKLPPPPADCQLDWGNRFMMSSTGKALRVCHGDTIGRDPKHAVLGYGQTWRNQGFTCVSRRSGLTCWNQKRHGWTLSRNQQKFF